MEAATILGYMLVAIMLFVLWWQSRRADEDRKKDREDRGDRARREATELDEGETTGEADDSKMT